MNGIKKANSLKLLLHVPWQDERVQGEPRIRPKAIAEILKERVATREATGSLQQLMTSEAADPKKSWQT